LTPLLLPRATDISADTRSLRVESLALIVEVRWAHRAGICGTLEGDMPYCAGDAIVTGVAGERWPVRADVFAHTYQACAPTVAGRDGRYRKRVLTCLALRLESAVRVEMNAVGDVLDGNRGDWLLQYEPSRHGIVRHDIFERTYRILGPVWA
jgi:hypothetical protein